MAIPATAIPNSWIGELWPALTSWIVFGAGRLGRGFLNLVADEADAKTLLIVAGRQTNRDMIQQYNENKYSVRRCGFLEVSLSNYHFLTYDNLSAISEVVSQPLTQVLSTSVGIENLGAVALAIAQGLNDRPHSKLQIIACENGLAPNAPKHSPSEVLREHLTNLIGPDALERSTEFPEAVADVIVPDAGSLHDPIVVSSGYLFLESTEATRRLFEGSQIVRLLKREDIAILRQRKLYCLNSLHSFLAVMGDLLGIATIEEVLGCPELIPTIRRLSSQLASATSEDPKYEIDGSDAYAYAEEVRRRMAEVSDPTDRVLLRAARGDYILDGRILGPIKDAGILKQPARASELSHAVAMFLYWFTSAVDAQLGLLPWHPAHQRTAINRPDVLEQLQVSSLFVLSRIMMEQDSGELDVGGSARNLVRTIFVDGQRLADQYQTDGITPTSLGSYFKRKITTEESPRHTAPACLRWWYSI